MSQPLGKEPGPLVPTAEATGAWSWRCLCSFQCALWASLHIPHSQWCKPHKPSESGHHLALVLLVGWPLFPCIARLTVTYTPTGGTSVPGSPGARPLQCPPPPRVRMVGQRPACKRDCIQAPMGSHLLLAEPFYPSYSSFSTTRRCMDSSCSPTGHTRVGEDLVDLQSKSPGQLAMLECWSILQAFA